MKEVEMGGSGANGRFSSILRQKFIKSWLVIVCMEYL